MPTDRVRVTTIFVLIALAAGAGLVFALRAFPPRAVAGPKVEVLLADAETGDERAVRDLIAQLEHAPASNEAPLARMLKSEQALVRAAACTTIGRAHEMQFAGAIWPRLSDDDWRVRAAGFEALQELAGEHIPFTAPLRDTPVEQREATIFDVMARWRAQPDVLEPLPQLCELYPTLDHWLAGPVLIENCLSCHAPSQRTYSSSQQCMSCHAQVHLSWFASAHSRSISHLPLARVDPVTKKVVLVNYGAREGLDCLSCHREADAHALAANITPIRPPLAGSRHRFDRAKAPASTCAACHAETNEQWGIWQSHPQPRIATWPPESVEWTLQSPAPSCVDCHMRGLITPLDPKLPHSFNTRRNEPFLIAGLLARIEPQTKDHPIRLLLTNLAGHSYPTGTHRRSLRVEVMYDDDDSSRVLVARLKHGDPVPTTQPYRDPLAPGEERAINLPTTPTARNITCLVTYERNAYVDTGYEVTLARLTEKLRD